MKKEVRICFFILIGVVLTLFSFNYIVFGTLNFSGIFQGVKFWNNDEYENFLYDSDYIDNNKKVLVEDANAIGTIVHTYNLELEDVPSDVLLLSIDFDTKNDSYNQITVYVYDDDDAFLYNETNFYLCDDKKVMLIQQDSVDKIVIKSIYEQYDTSELINEDILSLNTIEINNKKDISNLKSNLLFDFLVSVFWVLVIFTFIFVLFKTKIDKKLFKKDYKIENVFLVISIIIGIMFSVLFPLYQIPDELTHINMVYDEMNLDVEFQYIIDSYGDTVRIMRNYDEKVNIKEYFDLSKKIKMTDKISVPSIKFVRHFPQSISLIICSLLNLPVFVGITISEIMAVLFYSLVCYVALKLIPIKKEIMMFVMLLPMCIQQMGSFSYDVVLLPICFLLISYILYLKFIKDKIKIFDFIKILCMLFVIAIIKIPYIMLGALIILLPVDKIYLDLKKIKIDGFLLKKNRKKIFICLFLLFIPFMFLVLEILKSIDYGRMLLGAIKANISTIHLIANTLDIYGKQYFVELTGSFGWLDTPVSSLFTIFVFVSMLLISFFNFKQNKIKVEVLSTPFKRWETIYLIVFGIIMCCIIIFSLFGWTISITGVPNADNLSVTEYSNLIKNSISLIGGVQGRYFIPIIPLFLIPLFSKKVTNFISKINYKFYLFIYYIIVFGYMFYVILNRYWI